MPNLVVFTDLDGTLLDHYTYDWTPARPALEGLERTGTPLVLVSSKTRPEIEALRRVLGNRHPFVPENGGAVFIPEDYELDLPPEAVSIDRYRVLVLGRPAAEIAAAFDQMAARLPVRALSRMTIPEIAALTGLSPDQAAGAKNREFGEAFILDNPEVGEEQLAAAVRDLGLRLTRGGRFYHLLGENDKGRAVALLADLYRRKNKKLITAAVGDSPNDRPMLAVVDRPFLVARPDGGYAEIDWPGLTRIPLAGPAGFNQAVLSLLP